MAEARRKKTPGPRLSHVGPGGEVRMVDVSEKTATAREAVARGRITMSRTALRLVRAGALKKGDPLQTARLAGIMAAKQTSTLIPLCHPLQPVARRCHADAGARRLRHRGARSHHRSHWRRDGSADGGVRRGADDLRHGQGSRQDDDHRRHPCHREAGWPERRVPRVTILVSVHSPFRDVDDPASSSSSGSGRAFQDIRFSMPRQTTRPWRSSARRRFSSRARSRSSFLPRRRGCAGCTARRPASVECCSRKWWRARSS